MPKWDCIELAIFYVVFYNKAILNSFYLSDTFAFPSHFKCIFTNLEISHCRIKHFIPYPHLIQKKCLSYVSKI